MVQYGIANQNLQKLISKDNSVASSGDSQRVSNALMYSIYSNSQKICLDKILQDHGLYPLFEMNNNFRYIITLPSSSDVLKAQTGQTLDSYSLKNLELEYETIDNQELVDQISTLYSSGRSLSCEHLTLLKTEFCNASITSVNE